MWKHVLPSLFASLVVVVPLACAGELEDAFARAEATDDRLVYELARNRLVAHGEEAVPFLRGEAARADATWRERWLARGVLQRLQNPRLYQRWRFAFTQAGVALKDGEDGSLSVVLHDPRQRPLAERHGLREGMIVPPEALSVAIDLLRAGGSSSHRYPYKVLASSLDIDLMGAFFERNYREFEEVFIAAVRGLPAEAVPMILELLVDPGATGTGSYRIKSALRALGVIGTANSAQRLVEYLKEGRWAHYHDAILAALLNRAEIVDPVAVVELLAGPLPERKHYAALREVLLGIGERALPALQAVIDDPKRRVELRARATGIAFEIAEPATMARVYQQHVPLLYGSYRGNQEKGDEAVLQAERRRMWWRSGGRRRVAIAWPDVPVPFRLESAAVLRVYDMVRMLKGNELAIALVCQSVGGGGGASNAAVDLLGVEALPVLDGARQLAYMATSEEVLEALIRLGSPQGAAVAERIKVNRLASPVAAALRKGEEGLRGLLKSKAIWLQRAAAVSLLKRGDLAAVPVGFEMIMLPDSEMARHRAEAAQRIEMVQALAGVGLEGVEAMRAAGRASKQLHAEVVAEALAWRIENPAMARSFDFSARKIVVDHGHHLGPSIGDYHGAGKRLAMEVGKAAIPVLRDAVVRGERYFSYPPQPAVAAFALAELKDLDSLQLIAKSAGRLGSVIRVRAGRGERGEGRPTGSLAAAVLRAFGEAGIELAKSVPPPNPELEHFGARTHRHRGAAAALQGIDDKIGLEKIIEGLELASAGKLDAKKAEAYLVLAANHSDKRLLGPAAETFARYPQLGHAAGAALYKYKDPRIVPACLALLKLSPVSSQAWEGIGSVKEGERELFRFLAIATAEEKDEASRASLVRAHGEFRVGGEVYRLAKAGKIGMTAAQVEALYPVARRTLINWSADKSAPLVRVAAAETLAKIDRVGRDGEIVQALTAYVTGGTHHDDHHILNSIFASGDRSAIDAIVAFYQSDPKLHARLAWRLADIGRTEIIPDIVATLSAQVEASREENMRYLLIAALGVSKEGRDELLALVEKQKKPGFTIAAYAAMAEKDDVRAYDEAKALFEKLTTEKTPRPSLITGLASTLARMSWRNAYPLIVDATVALDDVKVQRDLGAIAYRLAARHPELKKLK